MKNIKELNDQKNINLPDRQFFGEIFEHSLFQAKVEKANETLRTIGLPKLTKK